jgi:hypothetical protein
MIMTGIMSIGLAANGIPVDRRVKLDLRLGRAPVVRDAKKAPV